MYSRIIHAVTYSNTAAISIEHVSDIVSVIVAK